VITERPLQKGFLFRQPIVNRQKELAGYQLLLRSAEPDGSGRRPTLDTAALCAAYLELGMRSALGNTCAYLGITPDFLQQEALELLPAAGVVLELLLDRPPDKAAQIRCRTLRERGYTLALADYRGIDDRSRPLLPMVDVIKIDASTTDRSTLSNLAGSLRNLPIKLLAQGVDSSELMERCRDLGFALFQGRHFAQAEIVSGRRLSASQAALIRLINLVGRH